MVTTMKTMLFTFLLFFTYSVKAQFSSSQIKKELGDIEWQIVKYETFGVEEDPKEEQVNDKILLNSNMAFFIVENGKEYHGNWNILGDTRIKCNSKSGEWSRTYKVISIADKNAALEYQDEDLTRTIYRLEQKAN